MGGPHGFFVVEEESDFHRVAPSEMVGRATKAEAVTAATVGRVAVLRDREDTIEARTARRAVVVDERVAAMDVALTRRVREDEIIVKKKDEVYCML